jgi:ABC-type multidrug transport system ATPase subunit
LEWRNLNFFVPVADPAKLRNDKTIMDNITRGLPEPKFVTQESKHFKQVLFNLNGYVKPGEMVAIIGPSGSGKTSLLNALSQRWYLSTGSQLKGDVSINGRHLLRNDFGKIAAYVQ